MTPKISLSTHILDTSRGLPASNVKVQFFKLISNNWLNSNFDGSTNADGRLKDFPCVDGSVNGVYKLKFEVGEYFQSLGQPTLYPFIEVSLMLSFLLNYDNFFLQISFTISSESHYHIPLLLNPFGYSTYRGS